MSISLLALARAVAFEECALPGGATVNVRALAGWEQALLIAAMPMPEAPRVPDPNMGSLSKATVPDFDAPDYVDAFERWQYRFRVAYAAASTGHVVDGIGSFAEVAGTAATPGNAPSIRQWVERAVIELAGVNYTGVIRHIYDRSVLMGVQGVAGGMDRAEKN